MRERRGRASMREAGAPPAARAREGVLGILLAVHALDVDVAAQPEDRRPSRARRRRHRPLDLAPLRRTLAEPLAVALGAGAGQFVEVEGRATFPRRLEGLPRDGRGPAAEAEHRLHRRRLAA